MHQRLTEHESGSETYAAGTDFSLAPPERRDDGLAANRNQCRRRNRRRQLFIHRRIQCWINLRTNFRPNHHTGSDHHTWIHSTGNQYARIHHNHSGHDSSSSRNRCSHAGYCESDARNSQPWIHHASDFTDDSNFTNHSNPGDHPVKSDAGDYSDQSDSRDDSGHDQSSRQQSWKHHSGYHHAWNNAPGRQPDFADSRDNQST